MGDVNVDIAANLRLADEVLERGIRRVLGVAEARVKEVLQRPGSGKVYRRGGVDHQASAAGEPPAEDIGNLIAATNANPDIIRTAEAVEGEIESKTTYSEALEKGTERMAARQFLERLNTEFGDELREAFREGVEE